MHGYARERAAGVLVALGHVVLWARAPRAATASEHTHQLLLLLGALLVLALPPAVYHRRRCLLVPALRVGTHFLGSQRSATVGPATILSCEETNLA